MKNRFYGKFKINHFENLESTNDEAFKMADSGHLADFEIIVADSQNKGRGRLNRDWQSPKGNLYFSLILRPKIDIVKIQQISFIAAIAAREAMRDLFVDSIDIKNKWPNDVLINDKKVCGILLESKIIAKNCEFVVVGIGINLKSNPENTIFKAANLQQFEIFIEAEKMLEKFLDKFDVFYQKWLNFGFLPIRNIWLEAAWNLNKEISISYEGDKIKGVFKEIDENGNLLLATKTDLKVIAVGDVG